MKKNLKFFLLLSVLFIAGCSSAGNQEPQETSHSQTAIDIQTSSPVTHDWDDIDIAGGDVVHRFVFKNSFDAPVQILSGETSCMCTTAKVFFADGSNSPEFGMHNNPQSWTHTVLPGEEFQVEVIFDPMAHGPKATGPIKRTVQFAINAPAELSRTQAPQFPLVMNVSANVLSSADFQQQSATNAAAKTASSSVADESHESETADHDEMSEHGHAELDSLEITLYQAEEQVGTEGTVFLDVREESELLDTGVIPGSMHIPLGSLSQNTLSESGIDKSDNIVVVCRSGNRSLQGAKIISSLGYQNVKSMQGGIVHWQEDGFELAAWEGAASAATNKKPTNESAGGPKISFDKSEHDFGLVGPTAVQQTEFVVSNLGDQVLEIGNITTSCMCTKAEISQKSIQPGASATLAVTFDPNVHEEPTDRFKRTVFLETNDSSNPEAEVNVWVDIAEDTASVSQ